jgi:hypothetical protein
MPGSGAPRVPCYRAIDDAQAAALRLGAVPVSVLSFVPKELGARAALRMCGCVGCALCVRISVMSRPWLELSAASARCAGAPCGLSWYLLSLLFLSGGGGWSGGGGGVGVGGTGHRVYPAHRREPRASKPKARPPLRAPPSHKPKTTKRKKDKENSDLSRRQKKKHVLRPAAYVICLP